MFTLDKLTKGQVFDLERLLGTIPPKDVPTLEEMKQLSKLRKKLAESVSVITTTIAELQEFLKPMREAKASDEEMNTAAQSRFDTIGGLRGEAVSVELSEDQANCFRRWFTAKLKDSISSVEAYLLVAEAIGVEGAGE